jgi:membrane fusion protein, multidrug efflux system
MILLVVLPVFAVINGLGIYLSSGRYISTDNAYVGAQKVLITPDISGKITHVAVREGQHVIPGDELFTLDREPFALALQQAKAKLDTARSDFDKLKSNLRSLNTLADLAGKNVELKQHDVDRKSKLVSSQAGSQADLDTAQVAVVTAQLQAEYAVQQRDMTLDQLLGNPDLPLEQFPEYAQAKAVLDSARISIIRSCVHQCPARPRRSTTSSLAVLSPPARLCSVSSMTRRHGSMPIRKRPTLPICARTKGDAEYR